LGQFLTSKGSGQQKQCEIEIGFHDGIKQK